MFISPFGIVKIKVKRPRELVSLKERNTIGRAQTARNVEGETVIDCYYFIVNTLAILYQQESLGAAIGHRQYSHSQECLYQKIWSHLVKDVFTFQSTLLSSTQLNNMDQHGKTNLIPSRGFLASILSSNQIQVKRCLQDSIRPLRSCKI